MAVSRLCGEVSIVVFSPAKLNLFLAITGRRADGFHELVSLVAPVEFGDTLWLEDGGPCGDFSLVCDDPNVPTDASNLVLRIAERFRAHTGWRGGVIFKLEKRIPMGAGLGGGSSNAASALLALDALAGTRLSMEEMSEIAAEVGSDCPLFLRRSAVVMRGRGEKVEVLDDTAAAQLRGKRVLIFKPAFGIATAWAYQKLAQGAPGSYTPAEEAEQRLLHWMKGGALRDVVFNTLERPAFEKFVGLPTLLDQLRREFGVAAGMSGSGSACFALLPEGMPSAEMAARVRQAWGDAAFVIETRLR